MDSKNIIDRQLKNYDFGSLISFSDSSGGYTNINYKVTTDKGTFFLRNYVHKDPQGIDYELRLMHHLQQHFYPTAYPISQKDGTYLSQTEQGCFVLFEYIEGREPSLSTDNISKIAKLIARLHLLPQQADLVRPNGLGLAPCLSLIDKFDKAPYQFPSLFEAFHNNTQYLQNYLSPDLPQGLIHGDAFPDNTILNAANQLFLIDFEETASDALLIDIAMTINGFCFIDNQYQAHLADHFVKEYNAIRPLVPLEKELLPYYIVWTAHIMLAWHLEFDVIYQCKERQYNRAMELMQRIERGLARLEV